MRCRVCAQEIPDGAKKCTHCGEFQTVFERVLSGLDLKGLLALLPLLTLIYAFLADRLETSRSNLKLTAVSCSLDGATVFGSNTGNRPAVLVGAGFEVGASGRTSLVLSEAPDQLVFPAGASKILALKVDRDVSPGGLVAFERRGDPSCRVTLSFSIVSFDHRRKEATSACACPST